MSKDQSKTVGDSMEETKNLHKRYLRAINNPVRRDILRSMQEGRSRIDLIASDLGLDEKTVDWHMRMLIDGFCAEKQVIGGETTFVLTKEGLVVDYMDK